MNNKLAIVIPAYKATFFRQTMESIASQSDKRFTLYIGDDSSPYAIKSIVDDFQDRIEIVYHRFEDNLGGKDLVAQWERCIALTNGEPYLWLFSDDDVMDFRCVENFYDAANKNTEYDVFRFDVKVIDGKGKVLRVSKYPEIIKSRELYLKKIRGSLECFVVEYIFKRDAYIREGGFVNFDLAWGSDLATWVKFGKETGILSLSNSCIYWRSSGENISTDYNPAILSRKISALVECLKWGYREFPDNETKRINDRGLNSRLSQIAVSTNFLFAFQGIKQYSNNVWQTIRLSLLYSLFYTVKRLRNVF